MEYIDTEYPYPVPARLLSVKQVMERVGLSRATIYRKEGLGEFPARVSISQSRVGWLESEINDWILNLVQLRGSR